MIKPLNIIKSNKDRNEVITPAQKTSTVTDRRKRISDCLKASLNSHHEHDCQYLDVQQLIILQLLMKQSVIGRKAG